MNSLQIKMVCQVCPTKRKVQTQIHNANRIYHQIQTLFPITKKTRHVFARYNGMYFKSYPSCHYSGSSCSNFLRIKRELEVLEYKLEESFLMIIEHLKEIKKEDESKFKQLKVKLIQLFQGYYPKAARKIMDLH